MRRSLTVVLLALVACGSGSRVFNPALEDAGVVERDAKPDNVILEDAAADVEPTSDAANESDAELLEDASASVDAQLHDAGADVGLDAAPEAGKDAAGDAPVIEAGVDARDAAEAAPPVDAGPPPCTDGQTRCDAYQLQACSAGTWTWQVGSQACCHDARFSVVGTAVTDATTGLHWFRAGGRGTKPGAVSSCPVVIPGGRLPTTAELLAITLGPPVNNISVCSPTIDQAAFQTVYAGDAWTSDGCVSLLVGASKAACTESTPGFLCVAP